MVFISPDSRTRDIPSAPKVGENLGDAALKGDGIESVSDNSSVVLIKKLQSERAIPRLQVPLSYVLDNADQHLDRGADEALSLFRGPEGGVAVGALVGRLVDPAVAGDLAGALGLRRVAVLLQAICFDPLGMQGHHQRSLHLARVPPTVGPRLPDLAQLVVGKPRGAIDSRVGALFHQALEGDVHIGDIAAMAVDDEDFVEVGVDHAADGIDDHVDVGL